MASTAGSSIASWPPAAIPETDAALAIRARRITSRRSRRRLADGLARVLRTVEPGRPAFTAAARPDVAEVLAARTVLASLERRLRGDDQIARRGAAMLGLLLTDCTGPLYQPDPTRGARQQAARRGGGARTVGRRSESVPVAPEAARDEALR